MKKAVISLSGGMDSSTLLLNLLANGYEVKCLSFDYGQKHRVELERARSLIAYLKSQEVEGVVSHDIVTLNISHLLDSSLVSGGSDVPEGHYENENMKATVVPNRNKIFSSIVQSVALSWANQTESEVVIALGIHAGDHSIYPDCRQEFRDADYEAFIQGNWNGEAVAYNTPYLEVNKKEILEDGAECCTKLGIDFGQVYRRTNTSYKPIEIDGEWYSDYKSASSVERIEAFLEIGRPDPVAYADETGPVEWKVAATFVDELLKVNRQ